MVHALCIRRITTLAGSIAVCWSAVRAFSQRGTEELHCTARWSTRCCQFDCWRLPLPCQHDASQVEQCIHRSLILITVFAIEQQQNMMRKKFVSSIVLWYLFSGTTLFLNKYIVSYQGGDALFLGKRIDPMVWWIVDSIDSFAQVLYNCSRALWSAISTLAMHLKYCQYFANRMKIRTSRGQPSQRSICNCYLSISSSLLWLAFWGKSWILWIE